MKKKINSLIMLFLTHCAMSFAINTDISTLDNVIYVEPLTFEAGSESSISLKMKNTASIRSFGFDLYLPEGITAIPNSSGNPRGSLNYDRVQKDDDGFPVHQMTLSFQEGNVIRFLCDAQEGQTFIGNEGEIATLRIKVSEKMVEGDYPIVMRGMKLSETDIANHYDTDYIESTVRIMGIGDGRTVLHETSTTVPAASNGAVDVRVKRTIKANEWSTICLPFAMTAAQVKDAFGENVALGDFKGYDYDGESIAVNFEDVSAIEANRPYIIKVQKAVSEFTVDCVDVTPSSEPMINYGTKCKPKAFIGTYVAGTEIENGCLFLNNNQFWYSIGSTKCKAFRAYFNFDDLLPEFEDNYAEVRAAIVFLDNTSGLCEIVNGKSVNGKWYDLSGHRITMPQQKGVYVIDGKKVIK